MKLFFLLAITSFISITSFGQTSIKLDDVLKYIGDSVTVCGKVASGRYLENAQNSPTFLNLGAAYPNQALTIVIWSDLRGQFEQAPEDLFKDKEVCVTGKITIYRERPQIVIYKKEQLTAK